MIDKLVNSRLFKEYIIKDYNVLGVYLGGSRQTGLDGETSDYDLVVLYDEPYNIPNESFVQINYKNIHIHWYYTNIREFASYKDTSIGVFGKLYPFSLDTKFIYGDFNLEWLKKYKKEYFDIAVHKFYNNKLKRYKEDLNSFHQLQYSKIIYYGEVMFYLITGSKLDISYLKSVKNNVKNNCLTQEQIDRINNHLWYIKNYVEKLDLNKFDVDYAIMLLNMKIYKEYQECIQIK